jgi:hypothetical protein
MTAYGNTHRNNKPAPHPDYHVAEKKAARKKVLDDIRQRRREVYKHMMEKKRSLEECGRGI